jgi:hypothetical protein
MKFELCESDAAGFTAKVERIIMSVISSNAPAEYYVVKIDNWFGPNWLAFSHKVMGSFGVTSQDLVIPPFVPNRVVSEVGFTRSDSLGYDERMPLKPIHIEQSSDANPARKFSHLLPNAAVFWWSGRSASNDRGSLMAYLPAPDGHVAWYLELAGKDTWIPSVTKGITVTELRHYEAEAGARRAV